MSHASMTSDTPRREPEKGEVSHVEESMTSKRTDASSCTGPNVLTEHEQKRTIRIIDVRVAVVLGTMFCISLMDRTNLGAAAIAGMTKDLELQVGARYSVVALIFFIPYILFEFPGTILARIIGPRIFLGTICVCWGIVMLCFGFVKKWEQLAGLRVLLGTFEAAFFPACVYLLSSWYTRYEVQQRFAVFFMIASTASAFAGVLAFGLMQMNGLAGLAGWRWIFIVEGLLTIVVGVAGGYYIVDFPDEVRSSETFLTHEQLSWVVERLQRDQGAVTTEAFAWSKFLAAGRSLPTWLYGLIACCTTTVSYCVAFFLPILLHGYMGFSIGKAQCLVAPPYAFSAILMLVQGYGADRYHNRGFIIIFNAVLAIAGLAILGWSAGDGIRYFGIFLITAGAQANVPAAMAYMANNVIGQWRRAFSSAAFVAGGGLGGIAGSLIFRSQDAPRYLNGIYGCIAANLVVIVTVGGLTLFFRRENKLAFSKGQVIQNSTTFRYTL